MKIIDNVNKKYGDGSAFILGKQSAISCPVIPTNLLKLDLILGVGGIPKGRIIEIYGPESSGKTTLCQHIIAECQNLGGKAAFVDVENSLDPHWLKVCNVDLDELIVSQPDYGEQALSITEEYIRSKEVDLVVVDSVAALVPKAEIEGEMGDAHMALQARLMSQGLRKLTGAIKQSNSILIFTNQLRSKIGVMFGSPETTTGGNALKFYASIRIDLRKRNPIKLADETIGNEHRVTIKKNKVAPPYKVTDLKLYFDEGFSKSSDILDLALELGIIQKGGSWFTFPDGEKLQGEKNALEKLKNDSLEEVESRIRAEFGLPLCEYTF